MSPQASPLLICGLADAEHTRGGWTCRARAAGRHEGFSCRRADCPQIDLGARSNAAGTCPARIAGKKPDQLCAKAMPAGMVRNAGGAICANGSMRQRSLQGDRGESAGRAIGARPARSRPSLFRTQTDAGARCLSATRAKGGSGQRHARKRTLKNRRIRQTLVRSRRARGAHRSPTAGRHRKPGPATADERVMGTDEQAQPCDRDKQHARGRSACRNAAISLRCESTRPDESDPRRRAIEKRWLNRFEPIRFGNQLNHVNARFPNVLLERKILIDGDERAKPGGFHQLKQLTVPMTHPTHVSNGTHVVFGQVVSKNNRQAHRSGRSTRSVP